MTAASASRQSVHEGETELDIQVLPAGIVGMCKEHLGVALALKVPVFFVVTKVDICPEHILKETLSKLNSILKKPGVRKRPFMVSILTMNNSFWECL